MCVLVLVMLSSFVGSNVGWTKSLAAREKRDPESIPRF